VTSAGERLYQSGLLVSFSHERLHIPHAHRVVHRITEQIFAALTGLEAGNRVSMPVKTELQSVLLQIQSLNGVIEASKEEQIAMLGEFHYSDLVVQFERRSGRFGACVP